MMRLVRAKLLPGVSAFVQRRSAAILNGNRRRRHG